MTDTSKWATPYSKDFVPGKGWEAYTDEEFAEFTRDNPTISGTADGERWTKQVVAISDAITVYYNGITTDQVADVCRMTWRQAFDGLRSLSEFGIVLDYIDDETAADLTDEQCMAVEWVEPESPWPEDWDDEWQRKIDAARRMGLGEIAERFAAEFSRADEPSEGDDDLEFDDDNG